MKKNFFKKLVATMAVATMITGTFTNAFAADETVDASTGWWSAHSEGFAIGEKGIELTFHSKSIDTISNNWQGPALVVYAADEKWAGEFTPNSDASYMINSSVAGYDEYLTIRTDMGASSAGNTHYGQAAESATWIDAAAFGTTIGGSFERTTEPDWANWQTNLKAGVDCKVVATVDGDQLTVVYYLGDLVSTTKMTIDTNDTMYLAVTGDSAVMSNFSVKSLGTPSADPNPNQANSADTADMTSVMPMLALAVVAMAAVVVARKKAITE